MDFFGTATRWLRKFCLGVRERAFAEFNPRTIRDVADEGYERYLLRASANLFEEALKSLKKEGEVWSFERQGTQFSVGVLDYHPEQRIRLFGLMVITPNTPADVPKNREAVALSGKETLVEIKERIRLTISHLRVFFDAADSAI